MDGENKEVLIIDDDDVMREKFRRMLRTSPYNVTEASSGSQATSILEDGEFDCVLLDYRLGDIDGLNLLPAIQSALKRPCPIIMITGVGDERLVVEAMRGGAYDYINKNHLHAESLTSVISAGMRWAELEKKLIESQERLTHLSLFDELTGLPNRHLFFDRLEQATLSALRDEQGFAVMMMDLNMFKDVNDTLGHAAGDELLSQVGRRLQALSRDTDTFSRVGGDEFAAILYRVLTIEDAAHIADKIIAAINTPFSVKGQLVNLGISVGIAMYPMHDTEPQSLLAKADSAMYRAKHGSRGYTFYVGHEAASIDPPILIGSYLGDALEHHEFYMHYQPQVDLQTGLCCGVEALARWNSSTLGNVPPDQFIIAAERSSMIVVMSYVFLEMVLLQARRWYEQGLMLPVSVNLSARLLDDHQLVSKVLNLLNKYNIPSDMLTLEITETALMASPDNAASVIRVLSEVGIQISIDDFGTGFTSFKYLREFALNELKIDKIFITYLEPNTRDASIVESFVTLAQGFNVNLIAEGVEDKARFLLLRQLGCGRAQGYWISRPIEGELIGQWVANWNENWLMNMVKVNTGG